MSLLGSGIVPDVDRIADTWTWAKELQPARTLISALRLKEPTIRNPHPAALHSGDRGTLQPPRSDKALPRRLVRAICVSRRPERK